MRRPEKCENCGYSTRYSRQQPGELPVYCAGCSVWMCSGCRALRDCDAKGHEYTETPVDTGPRSAVPPNDGMYEKIPEAVYHGDILSLSSSGARELLALTPEQFDFNRRQPPGPKPEYDFGHAAHKMVLGEGQQLFVLDPAIHGRTKDGEIAKVPAATAMWKQADATAREHGKLPITKANMDKAQRMAGRVFSHPLAGRLLSDGYAEMSIYWHDDATNVRRRARTDYLNDRLLGDGRTVGIDYKSARSDDPAEFERAILNFGYHMQQAWYEDALSEIGLDSGGFLFIVQSKTEPYPVSVCRIKPEIVELGRRQNRRALELYANCTETGTWPGYDEHTIHEVGMPGWAVARTEAALDVA